LWEKRKGRRRKEGKLDNIMKMKVGEMNRE
jgi:hypothetical protein